MVTGMYQDGEHIGAVTVEHLVAKLQRNQIGPISEHRIQLISGRWIAGTTAPGPGQRRWLPGDPAVVAGAEKPTRYWTMPPIGGLGRGRRAAVVDDNSSFRA